jgi:Sec-independent protein secretion pathway component TatC
MFIAVQSGQNWIVFAVLIISIITSKEFSTTLLLLISTAVIYFIAINGEPDLWIPAIFGLVILAILMGAKPEPEQQIGMGDMFGGMYGAG